MSFGYELIGAGRGGESAE